MVAWPQLGEHGLGLVLVWAWTALAGFAVLPWLRLRVGLAGIPLVGTVFWTLALYLFPFKSGLDVAAGLVIVLAAIQCVKLYRNGISARTAFSWSTVILLIGSFPYLTTLLCQYVPFGMDGSMHTTASVLIGLAGGLPTSHAPYAADVPFPPMNIGLSSLAGVAIRWGGEPAAVMLATHHLTFTLLILASYVLLRRWTTRTPAAVIAVASAWMARASEASLEWGGFPTVLSVAIGLFAASLLMQLSRSANWRVALAAGATVAAIPLIHGVGAGTWLYCVGPWIVLATLIQSRARFATLRALALSGVAAALVLVVYRAAGPIDVQAGDMDNTRVWQESSTTLGEPVFLSALGYIRKDAGSIIVIAGWAALAVLGLRRQWLAFALLGAAWLTMAVVVANSRWWVLPASFLLYPERTIYWAAPLTAVTLALAWRTLPAVIKSHHMALGVLALVLLGVAGYFQNNFYQKIVREDFVNADGWEALAWAKQHLKSDRDFVQTPYGSTGSFLPAIAQIGCTGAHHHHFIARQVAQSQQQRTITHALADRALAPNAELPAGTIVFQNRTITIVEVAGTTARAHANTD
ncbi:MAG TPA: hypothetical protein VFE62_10195 [Gemmataceae bacterium]|nr:hypothetical protein [Gemmataceae bacterium]